MNKKHIGIVTGLLLAISLALGLSVYYYPSSSSDIQIFDTARDTSDIHKIINDNWYWLIATPDYSIEHMLTTKSPNTRDPQYHGKLQIHVLRKDDAFIGFTAFYKKNYYLGQVLFIAVEERFRGKRYAQQLLDFAVDELAKQGVTMIHLVTRVDNIRAQALYKRDGFREYNRDDLHVYYEKPVNR